MKYRNVLLVYLIYYIYNIIHKDIKKSVYNNIKEVEMKRRSLCKIRERVKKIIQEIHSYTKVMNINNTRFDPINKKKKRKTFLPHSTKKNVYISNVKVFL